MKSKQEIEKELEEWQKHFDSIRTEQNAYFEQTTCRFWIEVLKWVLDED